MSYDLRENYFTFKHVMEEKPENSPDLAREHFHTSYEFLYFLKGSGNFIIQHNSHKLKPHILLVIRPGIYHNLLLNPGSEYERIVLRFHEMDIPFDLREKVKQAGGVYNIRGTRLSEELLHFSDLYKELPGDVLMPVFKSQLNIIIAYLCQCSELEINADYQDADVFKIITYISENLTEIQSMDQICEHLHMSKSLLQKRFYDYMKSPVMSYVRTQKCMLAESLLQKGAAATSVYLQCGFNDYSTFYRSYRKIFKHSPTEQNRRVYIEQ